MIENMKVEFGRTSDIDSWMRLVRKASWNFPGLETEQSIDEHKIIVLKFMNDKRALCVKNIMAQLSRQKSEIFIMN